MKVDYGMDYLDVDVDDGIAIVHVHDPNDESFVERAHPMHRQLRDVWSLLTEDESVRGVVFAGGYEYFFPVPRLSYLAALLVARRGHAEQMQSEAKEIFVNIVDFPKPLVVAAAGPVIGMGPQIAFLADLLVASRDATFTDTHVPLALASGDGATVVWPLVFGLARARQHVLRGTPLGAVEAQQLGVVSTLVETREELLPTAVDLARELAALPQLAFRSTKLALNEWLRAGMRISLDVAAAAEVSTFASDDFQALLAPHIAPRAV